MFLNDYIITPDGENTELDLGYVHSPNFKTDTGNEYLIVKDPPSLDDDTEDEEELIFTV